MTFKTVFLFAGQGSQHFQMARELFDHNADFRRSMLELDGLARRSGGASVIDAIYSGERGDSFERTLQTHPAIFMVEYSLARCLMNAGVIPDVVLGASLGTFAAAAVAGFLDVEQAMAVVMHQAVTFESSCEPGGMIAVLADPALFAQGFLSERSELAGVNFASHFVVAAPRSHLDGIEADLRARSVTHQRLAVSAAFHSRWIDDAREPLQTFMRTIRRTRGRIPLMSCESAQELTDPSDDFFWRVVREPIRFRDTLAQLERSGPLRYIDVGPGGTMAAFAKYGLPSGSRSTTHPILTPFGQDQKHLSALLAATTRP